MVSSVEGLGIGKDQPSSTDLKFINETLDSDEENGTVAEVGADESSKNKKVSIATMESNDQNKHMDGDEVGRKVWSVDTEYRNTND